MRRMILARIGRVPVHELSEVQRLRKSRRMLRRAEEQLRAARREVDAGTDPRRRASLLGAIGLLEEHVRSLLAAIQALQPRASAGHDAASVRTEREHE